MQQGDREHISAPQWLVVKAFALAILVGAILLATPLASSSGQWTSPGTALFTATSATCVTGLTVVDTGHYFTLFGHLVILYLIQLGGLGIMTFGTFLLTLVGRRMRMQDEFILKDSLGDVSVRGLRSLLSSAVMFTFLFEGLGALLIAHRLIARHNYPLAKALFHGLFHSVSAFCNAGFSLYADSLMGLRADPVIIMTIAVLVVIGGLGFLVLHNLSCIKFWSRDRLHRGGLSLHTKIVLIASGALILWGWLWFMLIEWNNTLTGLSWTNKIACSLFQSITPRTAGFHVVDMAAIRPSTLFHSIALMFIGGSPGSTAGGIKTTTLVVLIFTVVTMVRGRQQTELHRRTVPATVVREALSIFLLSGFCVCVFFGILINTEHALFDIPGLNATDALLFETVSAFATVGLSMGITPALSAIGKLVIIVCMFVGRLGPLTIALVIGVREVRQSLRYPDEDVVVG